MDKMFTMPPPHNKAKILVGMSGGIDSTISAYLLQKAGWEVIGISLLLWGGSRNGSSCSTADETKAQEAANELGIKLIVKDWTDEFNEKVVSDFNQGINQGKTLNPCISCNSNFKIEGLVSEALELGIDYIATGHYAKIESINGIFYVKRAEDIKKDQSYVMYMIPEEYRKMFVFPLGGLDKDEVRELASINSLSVENATESMGLCFSPKDIASTESVPVTLMSKGESLGKHDDGRLLTIGQRKGLTYGGTEERLYVSSISMDTKTVELVPNKELMANQLIFDGPEINETSCYAQLAAHGQPKKCRVNGNTITFEEPVRRVSPGQTVVIYGDDELKNCVLTGGTILNFQ